MKALLLALLMTAPLFSTLANAQGPAKNQEAAQDDESATSEPDRQKYTKLMTMKDQSDSNWFKKNYAWNFGLGASMLLGQPAGSSYGTKASGLLIHAGVENYFTHDFAFGGYLEYSNPNAYFDSSVTILTLGVNPRYIIGGQFYVGAKGGVQFVFDGSTFSMSGELGPQIGWDFPINNSFTVGVETNLLFFSTVEHVTFADWQALAMLRVNVGP